jgi:membrane fusion protein, multidrug efflux system
VLVRNHLVIVVLLLAVGAAACEKTSGEAASAGGGGRGGRAGRGGRGGGGVVSVQTAGIQRMSVQRQVDLAGTLLSPDQAKISSEVAGRVRDVPVQLGTEVRAGDVLVRIEPQELQLALDRAESQLRQVEAQLGIDHSPSRQLPADDQIASVRQAMANRDDARNTFKRAEQLHGRGLMSQVDYDTAETRLKVADANHQAALDTVHALKATLQDRRAAYELAQKKVADAVIKAPVAGSVSERLVQPGEFIRENTPVATIVQMSPLKLKTAVQEKFAGVIKAGQRVDFRVEAFPSEAFQGKIAYVSPAVDQATRTFPVEAIVDNANRHLKPGFFAKGTIATKLDENVMAVTDDAVSTLAGVSTVYVIENGKARQQAIALGVRQGKLWEITDGLKGDETLASSNLNQLATGTTVRIGGGDGEDAPAGGGAANGAGRRGGRAGRGRVQGQGEGQGQGRGDGGGR